MTLRTRNKFYLAFFIISLVTSLIFIGITIFFMVSGKIYTLEGKNVAEKITFFSKGSIFSVVSILLLLLYTPTVVAFICFGFEKTHSDEMIFFLPFLICTLLEGFRLFYPLQNLFLIVLKNLNTVYPVTGIPYTSTILIRITKLIVFIRTMAYLSLLCIPIFPIIKKYMTAIELILLSAGISIIVSSLSRLKINDFTASFIHTISGRGSFFWAVAFVILTTFLLIGNYYNVRAKKMVLESLGYLELIVGYIILEYADSIFKISSGALLMVMGTILYLRKIHTRLNS